MSALEKTLMGETQDALLKAAAVCADSARDADGSIAAQDYALAAKHLVEAFAVLSGRPVPVTR